MLDNIVAYPQDILLYYKEAAGISIKRIDRKITLQS